MTSNELEFEIVLATRNRPEVLQLSIPLMLAQSRLPRRFIVVDSSQDHMMVRRVVEDIFRRSETSSELLVMESPIAGTTHQRNVGLKHVGAPVVVFPDDDALWHPGAADALMRIYERDVERAVGCVGMSPAPTFPAGMFASREPLYRLEVRDRVAKATDRFLTPVEESLFPDPMHSRRMWVPERCTMKSLSWLSEEDAELCGPVTGYRMSFRTEVIRELGGFDERLGTYGLYEDFDASIGCLQKHHNVLAGRSKCFHYRVPSKRVSASEFGIMAILNRTYITCKYSLPRSTTRSKLIRYLYYKLVRYFLQSYTHYGRRRLVGAIYAMPEARRLMDVPIGELSSRYVKARTDCLNRVEKDRAV